MKVLLLNGSPHEHGTTRRALDEMTKIFSDEGIEAEVITIGKKAIRGCIACNRCDGRCRAFDDEVNVALTKMETSDALVIASPVYFASPNGTLISFLDRMFYAGDGDAVFAGKPAACVVAARRAGTTASLEALYKYPMVNGMPVVSSSYWPMVHGSNSAQAEEDAEGMQMLRNLAHNLVWMMRCIELGQKNGLPFPAGEAPGCRTDFIRN